MPGRCPLSQDAGHRTANMKSQDVVILLKLIALREQEASGCPGSDGKPVGADAFSVRGLERSLGISKSEISASLKRSVDSGLAVADGLGPWIKPNRRHLCDFIAKGLKFVFPAKPGARVRGLPT